MADNKNNRPKRKYEWMDEYIKRIGEVAMEQAKKNNTYIVYEKDGKLVKEYPNGKIIPLNKEKE
ncbi:hypothetical protein CHI12_11855 [Terribacillus saccharophilus]|uniref:Uncharacterized protein n=1 Tax=Terribacillus saccharophilus TaxID=361277 RepID=A0A268HBB9_9BACI|nr:hypothetical protein [Terribacillus saccharophilus]PAE07171.1 hypothetical protein CHI12_11855 [Terribacillus saccharophilus]